MRIWKRVLYQVKRRRFERELAEELRIHQEMVEDELRREGTPEIELRRRAHLTMGNVTKSLEDSRVQWNFAWIESLLLDIRYALRSFRKTPIFAATVIGTIGLALGLNAALFSIFNAYVLRPFAVRDPYGLYQFGWNTKGDVHAGFTAEDLKSARGGLTVFSDVFAYQNVPYWVSADGQDLWGAAVSGNYFTALGVGSALGRTILPRDDETSAGSAILVLSYTAWKNKFGAAPHIAGKTIHVRGHPFEIIGVARPAFGGLGDIPLDFWVPLANYHDLAEGRDESGPSNAGEYRLIGSLKPGVSLSQAKAALRVWAAQRTADAAEKDRAIGVALWPRGTSIPFDMDLLVSLSPLIAAFGLVLLIACSNVANMMLASAMARQREIGIRLSLGAGRSRLIRQLLTESLLLALPAAGLGFVIAQAAVHFGVQLMFATTPPFLARLLRVVPLEPDGRVFLFVLIAAGCSALFFGLAPAIQATRPGLMYAMRGDFSTGLRGGRLRNGLIVAQVTVCVLLLICAGVLLRGSKQLQTRDFGLDTGQVLALQVQHRFHKQVVERLALEPAVETVAAAWRLPFLDGFCAIPVTPAGRTDRTAAATTVVTPEYFSVFRIPLVRGRNFTAAEATSQAHVTIVSEATARRFWPNQDALGQTIRLEPGGEDPRCKQAPRYQTARVIGIARNVTSGLAPDDDPDTSCLYFPADTSTSTELGLVVRVKGEPEAVGRALDNSLAEAVPGAVDAIISMREVVAALLYPFRAFFWVASCLGGLALVLTVSGIYGVMSYLVSQRAKEIGIRMALGATSVSVISSIMRQALRVTVVGIAIGALLAAAVSRLLASVIVMVNTFDRLAYFGAVALVLLAAIGASFLPSRRAAQIDPVTTLRLE